MFQFTSIEQYHAQLKAGSVSCLAAVEHYLRQIEATKHLNAFVEVFAEEAIERAKELDASRANGKEAGPLHGVVIGIKDVICYRAHRVTAASAILKNFISLYSATAVEKLLEAEAIIIGSLNCDEFAMGSTNENSVYGPTLNAHDESLVPGGSSGGSAVAIQARLCMISLGSDTGGSVRQPADFCGVIGFKPSYGRISRHGLVAYASSFDQIGIFRHSITDIARALEVMAGPDQYDSTVSGEPLSPFSISEPPTAYRFAWLPETLSHAGLDPEIKDAITNKLHQLQEQGHSVEPVHFDLLDYVVPAYYVLTTAEASSNLSRYDGVRFGYRPKTTAEDLSDWYKKTRSEGFGLEVKRRIMLGTFVLSAGYYEAYYTRAQQVRRLVKEQLEGIFRNYDFIIMPNSPLTAFPVGQAPDDPVAVYLSDIYTVMANLAGLPAISLPLFHHSNGMTFGMQVLAKRMDEVSLLRVSHLLLQDP